jgi:hypothetical protein
MAWEAPFLDGFDHYLTADLLNKWNFSDGIAVIQGSTVRNSTGAMRMNNFSPSYLTKSMPTSRNFCVGFALRLGSAPGAGTITSALSGVAIICDAAGGSSGQVCLQLLNDGKFRLVRTPNVGSGSGVLLATGTAVLSSSTWYYIEIKVFLDATAGKFEVKINGVVDATFTGNTVFQAFNTASKVALLTTTDHFFDDLYIRVDSAATTETSGGYLGDVSVKPYYPNADGTYTAMTCSTGSTHNTLVDETTPNTSDYVSSATALTKDSFGFQDVSGSGAIKAVQMCAYASKNDSGFRGIDLFCRSSSTESFTAYNPLSTSWKFILAGWLQDPNTSADWSQAGFNAAEFGVRVSADL